MLTRLYRYGATRQAVLKGFIVAGENPAAIIRESSSVSPFQIGNSVFAIRAFSRYPGAIWLDGGAKWLHSRQARDEFWREFAVAVTHLADKIKRAGGILLPNAVRPSHNRSWRDYLCNDVHIFQTTDEQETAVFCNLLRNYLPSLIALTANSGITANQVHKTGSRRLSESVQEYAPHHLISAAAPYLKRVGECLRRDHGIQNFDSWDVHPLINQNGAATAVVLRFTDGQHFLSTVRAQAILYQALFISARNRARNNNFPPPVDHRTLLRNRARAIADGLQARFEREPERENRQSDKSNARKKQPPPLRAKTILLRLFEQLQDEFQTLEAEYDELAPIVLGLTLRRMGRAALATESDWLRMLQRSLPSQNTNLPVYLSQTLANQDKAQELKFWNEKMFSASAQEVSEWWRRFLYAAV